MPTHSVPALLSAAIHLGVIAAIGSLTIRNVREMPPIRVTVLHQPGGGSPGVAAAAPPASNVSPERVAAPPKPVRVQKAKPRVVEARPARAAQAPAAARPALAPAAGPPAAVGAGAGMGSIAATGSGRGNGDGTGSGTGRSNPVRSYLGRVRDRIERAKQYPPLARRRGVQGRVAVAFELTRAGELRALRVAGPSHPLLDRAALAAVESAAPFPQLPPEVGTETLRVEVALRFTLEERP